MERTPFPDFITNAPELAPGLALFYLAYQELTGDRDGNGPIKWTAIMQYAAYYDFDEDQFEALVYHCRALDNVVLKAREK